jgi:hypothetical protein
MENFFRPPPEVLAFMAFKKYIYLQALLLLSAFRWLIDAKVEKQLALASLMLSAIGLFALFGLGFFEIYSGPLRQLCLWWSRLASGAGMMLIASVPLAIAAFRLHRRYRWTDMLHAVLLMALITLWGMII